MLLALKFGELQIFWTAVEVRSVHTFTCSTHIFLHVARAHTRMAEVSVKRCLHICVVPLHLAFSILMSHQSLLFLHGHFETTPDYDFTHVPVHTFLPYFPVLKAQDTRNSAPASRSFATWPSQMQTHEELHIALENIIDRVSADRSMSIRVLRMKSG